MYIIPSPIESYDLPMLSGHTAVKRYRRTCSCLIQYGYGKASAHTMAVGYSYTGTMTSPIKGSKGLFKNSRSHSLLSTAFPYHRFLTTIMPDERSPLLQNRQEQDGEINYLAGNEPEQAAIHASGSTDAEQQQTAVYS